MALTGCRLEVTADVELSGPGAGAARVVLGLDRDLLDALDELGVDAVAGVEQAVAAAPDWDLETVVEPGAGLRLELAHAGGDPLAALRELSAALAPEDPGLHADLRLDEREEERVALTGTAELAAPSVPGAVDGAGRPVGPDAERLAELARRHVTGELVVTMPGTVHRHDADEREGRTLRWRLPVGEEIAVEATSSPGRSRARTVTVAAGALAAVLALALLGVWWRRRRA